MREYLLLKHAYGRDLTQSAGKDASAKTLIHPCLQNLACPNLLRNGGPQSVLDETCHHKETVLTEEKLEGIRVWLQISPRKCLRQLSQEASMSIGSAAKATKLIKFRPYRVKSCV
jgi:hypothetical protein